MTTTKNKSLQALKKYWGYEDFRPPQAEIVASVLDGKDTFVLMPTGGGKSLCYQVPAVMSEGVTLVITPLIALMKDQVANLKKRGIEARALHSGLYRDEIENILERAINGRIRLLYLSPERVQSALFTSYLEDLSISLIAVDEAHCISQWGYDFRPSYLEIASLREYTQAPIMALTGSADATVIDDIIAKLDFREGYQVFKKSFVRQNLCYRVKYASQKANTIADDYRPGFSAITYASTRGQTEKTAHRLSQMHLPSNYYHAGLSTQERDKRQSHWMQESPPMMVCTNAFGMGIDKPNVRQVFHAQVPPSPEAYYQEAGRAGRDGKFATATLIYSERDLEYLDLHLGQNNFDYSEAQKMYDLVFQQAGIAYGQGTGEQVAISEVELARKSGFSVYKILKFLKYFGHEGFWAYSENEWDLRPSIKAHRVPESQAEDQNMSDPTLKVHTALFRLYQNLRYQYQKVNLEQVSQRSQLDHNTVLRALHTLDKQGDITLRMPIEGSHLLILKDRVPSDELSYNTQKLKDLNQKEITKVYQMKEYVKNTTICRPKLLISYFGEEVEQDCGICDICQQYKGKINKEKLCTFVSAQKNPHIKDLQAKFFAQDRDAFLSWLRLGIQLRWWEVSGTGNIKLLLS